MHWEMLTCWTGSGEKPLKDALKLMNNEGITSLAVVDNQYNVVGNISNVDVKVDQPHLGATTMQTRGRVLTPQSTSPNPVPRLCSKTPASISSRLFSLCVV